MTKAPISLQYLRRSLYVKAKAEPSWRFWGLYHARGRQGFGWKRWSSRWFSERLGLFNDYKLRRWTSAKAAPAR
jgi:hypothetical protein